jgi:hypothetical protein
MRCRVATLVVLLVASTLVPAAIAADDTRTLRVADVGLWFAVPKSWVSVNVVCCAEELGERERP